MSLMRNNFVRLAVRKQTAIKLNDYCAQVFFKDNPDLSSMKMTQDFMLNRVCDFYLKGQNYLKRQKYDQ